MLLFAFTVRRNKSTGVCFTKKIRRFVFSKFVKISDELITGQVDKFEIIIEIKIQIFDLRNIYVHNKYNYVRQKIFGFASCKLRSLFNRVDLTDLIFRLS